jgi:hypothetical protein
MSAAVKHELDRAKRLDAEGKTAEAKKLIASLKSEGLI